MKFNLKATAKTLILALFVVVAMGGCGPKEDYTSEKAFLASLPNTGETEGAIPPVDEDFGEAAHIRVDSNEIDMGVIANNDLHHAKLKIYNDGKMPLELIQVDTTCACTQGFIESGHNEIPPGGESWIDIVIDPRRIPGFKTRKVLTISSSDPKTPQLEVGVTSHVDPEFALEMGEEGLDVGDIPKGEVVTKRVRFRQIQEAPITVNKIEPITEGPTNPKLPGISAKLEDVPENQWKSPGRPEYDIVVTIGPDIPAGPFKRYLMLFLDLKRINKIGMPIVGTINAPYAVSPVYPERAVLVLDKTGTAKGEVLFKADAPITLSNLTADVERLTAAVVPGASPNEAKIEFSTSGVAPEKGFDDVVHVDVTVAGQTFHEIAGVRFGNPAEQKSEH